MNEPEDTGSGIGTFRAWCVACPNPAWGHIDEDGNYEIHHTCDHASPSLRFKTTVTQRQRPDRD